MLGLAPQAQTHAHHGAQVLQEWVARLAALGRLDARHPLHIRGLVLRQQPGFQALLAFGREGHAIKLSGPFRASTQGCFPWDDVDPFIAAAIDAFTIDRCVWGSDWPFVRMDDRMDYGPALACLARWVPGAADREKVLWHNPARLFGFS